MCKCEHPHRFGPAIGLEPVPKPPFGKGENFYGEHTGSSGGVCKPSAEKARGPPEKFLSPRGGFRDRVNSSRTHLINVEHPHPHPLPSRERVSEGQVRGIYEMSSS